MHVYTCTIQCPNLRQDWHSTMTFMNVHALDFNYIHWLKLFTDHRQANCSYEYIIEGLRPPPPPDPLLLRVKLLTACGVIST